MKKIVLVLMIGLAVLPMFFLVGCGGRQRFCYESFFVTLTNEASLAIIDESIILGEPIVLTIDFFSELDNIESVIHSIGSLEVEDNVRRQRMGEYVERPVNQTTFRISLNVYLTRPSRQIVLRYVELLNSTRNDIEWASRNNFVLVR